MRGALAALSAIAIAIALGGCQVVDRLHVENATGADVLVHVPAGQGGARYQVELQAGRKKVFHPSNLGDVFILSSGRCYYEYELPWTAWKAYVEKYGVNRWPNGARIDPDFTIHFALPPVIAQAPVEGVRPEQVDGFVLAPSSRDCR